MHFSSMAINFSHNVTVNKYLNIALCANTLHLVDMYTEWLWRKSAEI